MNILQTVQTNKAFDKINMDDTKQTFMDRLRNYQTLGSFVDRSSKVMEGDVPPKRGGVFFELGGDAKSSRSKLQHATSPRFGDSLSKRILNSSFQQPSTYPPTTKNSIQEFKKKLYYQLDTNSPDTCYSLLRTKFTTQQTHHDQQLDKCVSEMSIVEGRYMACRGQQQEEMRGNYLGLDEVEVGLVGWQKANGEECTLVVERVREVVVETIRQSTLPVTTAHKAHVESTLKSLSIIDQSTHSLSQDLQTQTQISQQDWCQSLDRINDCILEVNSLITEMKIEENDRFTDLHWKVKEMQFACEEGVEKVRKERLEKEARLYGLLDRLIQKVGSSGV